MTTAENIAEAFHRTYSEMAPLYGWEPEDRIRVPFFLLPESNRKLMTAVVEQLLEDGVIAPPDDDYGWGDSDLARSIGANGDGGPAAAEHFRRRRAEREEERRAVGKAYLAEEQQVTATGPYPDGFEWRCGEGHTYPQDFEPLVCPEDGRALTRVVMALSNTGAVGDLSRHFAYRVPRGDDGLGPRAGEPCAYPGCGKPWNDEQHTHFVLDADDPLDDSRCTVGPIDKLAEWQKT